MKNKYFLSALFLFIVSVAFSQSIPRGMNYQAVARDKSGEPMADKIITLKIELQNGESNQPAIYYSEIHRVITNKFGLFTVVIGKGSTLSGDFNEIPWSTENIWLAVGIKMETEIDFTNISSTKLLAVPYAFHAGTASQLSGNYTPYVIPGSSNTGGNSVFAPGPIPASSWQVAGNTSSNPPTEYVGNGDAKDLVVKTNGIEQMRIYSTGNINMNNSLTIGVDLTVGRDANINRDIFGRRHAVIDSNFTVKYNVNLNATGKIGGATINYGPFTVANVSPTILTGSLRVDQITNLQNGLNVNNVTPTLLTGTLRVNGKTDLFNSFTVNSKSSGIMTGTLQVDSNVIFKQHLTLDNATLGSSHWSNGALVTAGGVGIAQNLNVRDSAKFGGPVEFAGQVKIKDDRAAYTPDSGSLIVTGGVGIGSQLNVRAATHLYDSLQVGGPSTLDNTLLVDDATTLNGGVNANKKVTITAGTSGPQNLSDSYALKVLASQEGIAVKVQNSKSRANNFMSFWDSNSNAMQGRIEGYTAGEYQFTNGYADIKNSLDAALLDAQLTLYSTAAYSIAADANLIATATAAGGCFGFGACAFVPPPSLGIVAVIKFAGAQIALAAALYGLVTAESDVNNFNSAAPNKTGVTYESGAGDYAEYLEMSDANETMFPGDIVGLRSGKISRNTEGADKIMVISKRPIVLGNTPKDGNEKGYKKVAFMGQVPVQVIGKVNPGDYILPDGNHLGMGTAVSPSGLKAADIKNIVGTAWSGSDNGAVVSTINVAVGLNVNDNQKEIEDLKNEINDLNNQLVESDRAFEKLIPGYKPVNGDYAIAKNNNLSDQKTTQDNSGGTSRDIQYHEFTKDEISVAFGCAIKIMEENKKDHTTQAYLSKLKSDPALFQVTIDKAYKKVVTTLNENKELDQKYSK